MNLDVINFFKNISFLNLSFAFLFCAIIVCRFFYKKIVGAAGEHWTKKELKKLPEEYLVINDIMIEVNGKTTQIDHVVVSKYKIFVIETKQYNGYVSGNDYDKNWYFKAKKKLYIPNPIHQNHGHLLMLKELLNLDESLFCSIVCITSNAKLNINSSKVVTVDKLLSRINEYKDICINNCDEIYNKIVESNIDDVIRRKQHNRDVKKIIKQKSIDSINKCPKCGGNLVKRTGKYGEFMGCSNFPKCKYIKK